MRWCRFQIGAQVSHGIVEDDTVKLLAPVIPPIPYAAGPNYRGHLEGMAKRRGEPPRYPARPEPKLRSPRAIIGPGDSIVVLKESTGADRSHPLPRQELRHVQAVGPWIVTGLDPRQFRIVVRHNSTVGRTSPRPIRSGTRPRGSTR